MIINGSIWVLSVLGWIRQVRMPHKAGNLKFPELLIVSPSHDHWSWKANNCFGTSGLLKGYSITGFTNQPPA